MANLAAGPWEVRRTDRGWGCYTPGENEPVAELYRHQAHLMAAALPAAASRRRASFQEAVHPRFTVLDHGDEIGSLPYRANELAVAFGILIILAGSVLGLAYLLRAVGALVLDRVGSGRPPGILAELVDPDDEE